MGKKKTKQLELFETPGPIEVFIPELWAQEIRKVFTQRIAWSMAQTMDDDILKALAEAKPGKSEITEQDIEKAQKALEANDRSRTATELAILAERQRQSDFRNAILSAQQRQQGIDQQEGLRRRGLSQDYLRQRINLDNADGLDTVELMRKYAKSVGAEKMFKDRAKPKATEEEMRGILSEITAADLIIKFMNSGWNDFKGWLNTYINENLDGYREKQATKTEVGGTDPIVEDAPRTILSGN